MNLHSENQPVESVQETNPYRHDHNPLNEDFHGGICSACEWDADELLRPDPVLAALDFLVQASRASSVLRSQVQTVEDEIRRLRSLVAEWVGLRRDLTACRSELASLALWLQDRHLLPTPGGDNYALVVGAAVEYMLSMELAVVALNEDRKDLTDDVEYFRKTIVMLWDLMPLDQCVRFSGISPARYETVNRLWGEWDRAQKAGQYTALSVTDDCDIDCDDEHHAPMCPHWDGHPEANCDPPAVTCVGDEVPK